MIGNVADYQALEAGTLALEAAPLDLCAMLDALASEKNEKNRACSRACIVQFAGHPPDMILADARHLRQAVSNVLDSALGLLREGTVMLLAEMSGGGPGSVNGSVNGWKPCAVRLFGHMQRRVPARLQPGKNDAPAGMARRGFHVASQPGGERAGPHRGKPPHPPDGWRAGHALRGRSALLPE